MTNFQNEVRLLSLERTTWKRRRDLVTSKKGLQLIKFLLLPALTICLDMEQFVLVPASVYNKSLNKQSIAKQELPKYRALQNPTYQIDPLQKEINSKLFAKADSLVDKYLSYPHIKLSQSQTLILDDVTWCFTVRLCSTTASQKRRCSRHLLYFK